MGGWVGTEIGRSLKTRTSTEIRPPKTGKKRFILLSAQGQPAQRSWWVFPGRRPHLLVSRISHVCLPNKLQPLLFSRPLSPSLGWPVAACVRHVSTDDDEQSKDAQDAIQKLTDATTKTIDEKVSAKEKDILKV